MSICFCVVSSSTGSFHVCAKQSIVMFNNQRMKACSKSCDFDVTDEIKPSDLKDMSLTVQLKGFQSFRVCDRPMTLMHITEHAEPVSDVCGVLLVPTGLSHTKYVEEKT